MGFEERTNYVTVNQQERGQQLTSKQLTLVQNRSFIQQQQQQQCCANINTCGKFLLQRNSQRDINSLTTKLHAQR